MVPSSTSEVERWEGLRPLLHGGTGLDSEGREIVAWRGQQKLEAGTEIYRGCRAADEAAALRLLDAPRFWSHYEDTALEYARTCPSDRLKMLPGFLLAGHLTRDCFLAEVAMFPVVRKIYSIGAGRFGVQHLAPQDCQRLHMTAICRTLRGVAYDGVFDHGGKEILIVDYRSLVEVREIRRTHEPASAQGPTRLMHLDQSVAAL